MNSAAQFHQLSESQKSIWYLEKAYPGTSINIVAGTLRLNGDVNYGALQKAFNIFVKKNDSMRLRISETDGTAVQYLTEYKEFEVDFFDFGKGGLKELFAWDEETTRTPFDIIDKPLFYCAVFRISAEEGGAYMKMHHLISDAWTMGLLVQQLISLYATIVSGKPVDESPNPSYIDHLNDEQAYEKSARYESDRIYWGKKFETLPDMTVLKSGKVTDNPIKAKRKTLITPLKLSNKIREFCAEHRMSPFTLFMSALSIYINRVTGNDDIILGTTILNRVNVREKETTGMFVSVAAPIRISVDNASNFLTFTKIMLKENTDILRHQKYPYNHLIRDLKRRHQRADRLFDIVLSYQNSKLHKNETSVDYVAKWLFSGYQVESLVISINDRDDVGNLVIDYDFLTDIYTIKEIEFIHQHVINVLWHGLDNPLKSISRLNMVSEKEKHKLLHEFNDTEAEYPRERTIHQIFEEQADASADNIALVFRDKAMTYRELNDRANRLARTLRAHGIGPDDVVGLLTDRSFEMIIAILGVLKAGGAYIPIDPNYPEDRIKYTLENGGTKVLLTKSTYRAAFEGTVLYLDDGAVYDRNGTNLEPVNKPSDLAYIIYTSGSTGRPKGVMTEHRNIVGLLKNNRFQYDFCNADIWLQFHSYCFDFSSLEIFGALLFGGRLVLIPGDSVGDLGVVRKLLIQEAVTVLCQTPQSFYNLTDIDVQSEEFLRIRYFILGGESLNPALLLPLKRKYPEARFINIYGPTETTILVTQKEYTFTEIQENISNIGKSNPLIKTYVLDKCREIQPIGIVGELYISGNGLSRGYINNKLLTDERFVVNPFEENSLMYRTGDLVKRLPLGDLEYIGRIDNQVKIRGFRIELGEIENTLLKHPDIEKAIVVVHETETGAKRLCAYFQSGPKLTAEELSSHLSISLPDYMIPSFFIQVDEFPLNTNGKVDRSRLTRPAEGIAGNVAAVPGSLTEIELARIWSRILGVKNIGITDNFFFIGGDSLSAVAVSALVGRQFGVELSPRDIFRHKTISALGSYIDTLARMEHLPIPNIEVAGYYAASSAQKRQYILNMLDGGISYNIPGGLKITGIIDVARLQEALRNIIKRHESFRTHFEIRDGEPIQIIEDNVEFSVELLRMRETEPDALLESFVRPFDLGKAPLFRARLVSFSEEKHILLLDMHHIISDGASLNIIVREFSAFYEGLELPELKIQYKDYASWHNELLKSEKIKAQEAYWLERLKGEVPVLSMPLDYNRPISRSFKGDTLQYSLDPVLTAGLRRLAAETGTTLFMVMFSAYGVLLSRYTGQEDIIIGTPVEGRRHADLQNIVGMFVNTLALRTLPAGDKPFLSYLEEVREDLLNAYDNQEFPLEELVDRLNVKRDISRNPLFDTMFVLQNAEWRTMQLAEATAEISWLSTGTSKFDLTVEAFDLKETIEVRLEYSTDLFRRETVERLFSHYVTALHDIVMQPSKKLHEITILSEAERRRLLYELNDTSADYPRSKTIHQIFEEQAERFPERTALVLGDSSMTYRELNERANRLARTLRAHGAGPDVVVGLLVDRSFEMIISILGVLKAGGAYMPIDPSYPEERRAYMLEDSGAKLLLTKKALSMPFGGTVLYLDDEAVYDMDSSNLEPINKSTDLAYIIYTSGSTGRPKGVMTEHRNIVGLFFNDKFVFKFDTDDVWSFYHSYCFDLSAWEIYNSLLRGGKLIIISDKAVKDIDLFMSVLKHEKVTVLTQTPQSLYRLIDIEMKCERLDLCLRYVITGGEALKPSLLKTFKHRYPTVEFFNQYGPTETTLYVTQKWLREEEDFETNTSNIGIPNPLTRAYVLDHYGNPVPIGVSGELCISGNGVSRGYINNPEFTREKFVANPFSKGEFLYKTGDHVRMMINGDIEYLGRLDSQVKIRGYRIELGEIESVLLQHDAIEEALVIAVESNSGDKKICAYFISPEDISSRALSQYLHKTLPGYMIPSYFVHIAEFPLNQNGKVDKMKLPKPSESLIPATSMELPRNVSEERIASAWANVLDLPTIGIDDNFFEIGGDSLSAVKVVSMLKLKINIVDFYLHPTIRQLAEKLSKDPGKSGMLVNMSRNYNAGNGNVICFPYGGGSALSYRDISNAVKRKNARLNIYAVNLPGHDYGARDALQPMESVAEKLADEIAQTVNGEVILYGHCVGTAPLLATAVKLEKKGVKIRAIFIGGILAPRFIKLYGWLYKLYGIYFDRYITRYLRKFGVPEDILSDNEYIQFMSKAFRYDRQCFTKYFFSLIFEKKSRIKCPMYFVVGENDASTKRFDKMSGGWSKYFTRVEPVVIRDADHYFIHTHPDILTDLLLHAS